MPESLRIPEPKPEACHITGVRNAVKRMLDKG